MIREKIYMVVQWSGSDYSRGEAIYVRYSQWEIMKNNLSCDNGRGLQYKYVLYSEDSNDENDLDLFYSNSDIN